MKTETNVATKIDQLLARVAGVKRGSDISTPTLFDARGERHARAIAEADRGLGSSRNHPGQCGVAAISPLLFTHDVTSH